MAELVETYCGCAIYRELSGVYTSPCTTYARFTVDRVRQDIRAGGYCDEPEPEPAWEIHSVYRGIEIWVGIPDTGVYSAEVDGVWKYGSLSTIRLLIDNWLGPVEPEPEPGKVFVETYRGVDIYYDNAVYRYWFKFENISYSPATLNEAHTWIDTLLQPEPEPDEYWEYHSTYREILIYVWMPSEAYYQATFGGEIHTKTSLSTLQAEIDAFLEPEPEPPAGEVTIKIVTTESDPYARYHGMSIDQSLDSSFWTTQPDKVFKTTGAGFTYIQTVAVSEGTHYVIYGNSASAGYMWHAKIFVNDTLIAEGDVYRGNQLRGNFTVGVQPPVGIPTTTTITVPDKVGVDEKFMVSGILYETDSGIPITNQPINHSYDGKSLGSSITGVDGDYLKEVSIPESGVWTIKAEFTGTPGYAASSSLTDAIITATPIAIAIEILGPITLAIALFAYSRM